MDAIIIRKVDLSLEIKGMTILDDDGNYNIYLNARLSSDAQAEALRDETTKLRNWYVQHASSL